jgi:hypothetical protein
MDKRSSRDAAQCFAPLGGLFAGMKPPLAVDGDWEARTGGLDAGHARKDYALIHDLKVQLI